MFITESKKLFEIPDALFVKVSLPCPSYTASMQYIRAFLVQVASFGNGGPVYMVARGSYVRMYCKSAL